MSARTSLDPTRAQLWRRGRGPLAVGAVLVLLGVLTALFAAPRAGSLDPRGADRWASRAIAELLRARGVAVELVQTAAAAAAAATPGSTLLVARPDLLGDSGRAGLAATAADVVLLVPGERALRWFAPELSRAGQDLVRPREPRCALPAAVAAGVAELGDQLYAVRPGAAGTFACYPAGAGAGAGAALVQRRSAARTVTVLGSTEPLTNDRLAEQGNAALALRLLGGQPRLVWYLPTLGDASAGEQKSFVDLVPPGWWWGLAQLTVGLLLVAVWRARRLGPVVAEPLPVVVRSTETVEGRARLYRRARARDRAASELREATLRRLIPVLGLPGAAEPDSVIDVLARRTGRSEQALRALLYGPAPDGDDALVRLATDLDAVQREVRRS